MTDLSGLLLRAASPDDADAIVALTRQSYQANHDHTGLYGYVYKETAATLRESVAAQGWQPLLAELDGEPVGCVRISWADPERINLWRLGVRPDMQGRGIGRQLIDAVERWAAAWGRPWVTLGALEASPENQALYERLGYQPFGRKEMDSAPGNFYTLLRKPIPRPAANPTVARYEEIAEDYQRRRGAPAPWMDRSLAALRRILPPPARILDLGCGPGRDAAFLREAGYRVVGLDATAAMLRLAARSGADLIRADSRALPLADGALDGVWASASLLHLRRAELMIALADVRRALRPGGAFHISLKQGSGEALNDGRLFGFYGPDEAARAVRGAGFAIAEQWVESDERPGAPDWIHIVARLEPPAPEPVAAEASLPAARE